MVRKESYIKPTFIIVLAMEDIATTSEPEWGPPVDLDPWEPPM